MILRSDRPCLDNLFNIFDAHVVQTSFGGLAGGRS